MRKKKRKIKKKVVEHNLEKKERVESGEIKSLYGIGYEPAYKVTGRLYKKTVADGTDTNWSALN